ncbi:MAG: LytTR family DNA-binding domain-containing protein [Bacteroidales bacterium]|nr:LytTR family DNA-binding domain-containing protein [Bacteroidales bacterium]
MIRTIIIEDEYGPRMMLQQRLTEEHHDVQVVAACDSAEDALIETLRLHPDLLFCDIQLSGKNGLWLAEELHNMTCEKFAPPDIIFTTAFVDSQYLLNAFRLAALDYLVKPILPAALAQALERFRQKERRHTDVPAFIGALNNERLLKFKNYSGLLLLKAEDIMFVKADGNYAQLALASGDMEDVFERLGEIERRLPSSIFIRTDRSHIINKTFIRRLNTRRMQVEIATPAAIHVLDVSEKGIKMLKDSLT